MKTSRLSALMAPVLLLRSIALAGGGDKMDDHVFAVPGVVQTGDLVTVFQCTSTWPALRYSTPLGSD